MDLVSLLTSTTSKETPNPNAWDISKAYYDPGADAWNVSTAFRRTTFDVSAQEVTPTGVFFKPDGTKMYICGSDGDDVNEYTLSTPWVVSSASYVQNFSVSTQETTPQDLFFKPDGTKMYVIGSSGDDVNEYSLSSAWDISTASYVQNFSVATEETIPRGLFFKPDGTKMYVIGSTGDDVNEYSLSSAWNISTASYVQNFSVATEDTVPQSLSFKSDGTKMYVIGGTGNDINEYNLSTAWDISTASYVQNFSFTTPLSIWSELTITGVFFRSDGGAFFVVGDDGDRVYTFVLGGFSVAAEETTPEGLSFKPDGTKMYICGTSGDDVNEYSLSSAWDISTASYVQNFSVATQETQPQGLFFKPDGTKMYVVGSVSDAVNEYDLSSAWDVSTASYLQNFSVATEETVPQSVFFKPDGTKMYVIGTDGDDVNEYNLSTPWSVTSASYVQNFSVASQNAAPRGIFFKDDGTKMYVSGGGAERIDEYSLSSAWNISTASYTQGFSLLVQSSNNQNCFFKPDGTQFWIVENGADRVFSYLISPT
jgi:DNA-binding beta-propeller fold protein YncE